MAAVVRPVGLLARDAAVGLMAAPAAAVGAAAVIGSLISTAGDVTEKGIEAAIRLLETKIVVEFGADGYKVGGRRRTRKSGPKENPVRNRYDDRVTVRRVEVPLAAVFGAAYLLGWKPGGAIGALLNTMFGAAGGAVNFVEGLAGTGPGGIQTWLTTHGLFLAGLAQGNPAMLVAAREIGQKAAGGK